MAEFDVGLGVVRPELLEDQGDEAARQEIVEGVGVEFDGQGEGPDGRAGRVAGLGGGHRRVTSAAAFLAQMSSTRSFPSEAAAMRAAIAALLRARGRPLATRWRRARADGARDGASEAASGGDVW